MEILFYFLSFQALKYIFAQSIYIFFLIPNCDSTSRPLLHLKINPVSQLVTMKLNRQQQQAVEAPPSTVSNQLRNLLPLCGDGCFVFASLKFAQLARIFSECWKFPMSNAEASYIFNSIVQSHKDALIKRPTELAYERFYREYMQLKICGQFVALVDLITFIYHMPVETYKIVY